jgi:hypothetical protein
MTAPVGSDRVSEKPLLGAMAWSAGPVSVAGFAAAWVLAARNRRVLNISADFGPDRYLVAYPVAGAILASRRRSNPIGWLSDTVSSGGRAGADESSRTGAPVGWNA